MRRPPRTLLPAAALLIAVGAALDASPARPVATGRVGAWIPPPTTSVDPGGAQRGRVDAPSGTAGRAATPATAGQPAFAAPPVNVSSSGSVTESVQLSGGIPSVALAAYEQAASILSGRDPSCNLGWEDLAGIGRVESDNGLTWGAAARVTTDGTLVPPIIGPALDGQDGTPAIPTTDGGVLEHDPVWAHAVGPMQFLPSTWAKYGQDAVGSGTPNPQNFYDAALAAGVYLCDAGGNLATPTGLARAILAYNHSPSYVSLVEDWITAYTRAGAAALLSAGSGLLPTAGPGAGRGTAGPGSAPGGGGAEPAPAPPPTPEQVVAAAALATVRAGGFTFTLSGNIRVDGTANGGNLGTFDGSGAVAPDGAQLALTVANLGSVDLLVVGRASYLRLPTGGTAGSARPWQPLTPTSVDLLPPEDQVLLEVLAAQLPSLAAQFAGAQPDTVALSSTSSTSGRAYEGTVNLSAAAGQLGAGLLPSVTSLMSLLGGPDFPATVWLAQGGQLQRARFVDTAGLSGASARYLVSVDVAVDRLGGVSSPRAPLTSTTSPTTSTPPTTSPSS